MTPPTPRELVLLAITGIGTAVVAQKITELVLQRRGTPPPHTFEHAPRLHAVVSACCISAMLLVLWWLGLIV